MRKHLLWSKQHVVVCFMLALIAVIPARMAMASPVAKHHEKHPPKPAPRVTRVSGTVAFFNHSPKGPCDSLILKSNNKVIQVNFPPDAGPRIMDAVKAGDRVTVTGVPDHEKGDHAVVRAVTMTKKGDVTLRFGPPHPPGPKGHEKHETLQGKIARWNYARGGEVNGVVLENGDFIHLGPHGVTELDLQLGQSVTAVGVVRPLPGGHRMIEHPEQVNGTRFDTPHPPHPPHPAPPKKGPGKHHKKPPKKKHEKGHRKAHEHHKHHEHHGEHEHD